MDDFSRSDMMSIVVPFVGKAQRDLPRSANLGISEYRVLALAETCSEGLDAQTAERSIGMKKSLFSQICTSLVQNGLALQTTRNLGYKTLVCTETGISALRKADDAIALAHEEFFGCLGEEVQKNLLAGSVVTSVHYNVARMDSSKFLAEFANLDGSLRGKLFYTETAYSQGFGLTEMRVLLAVRELGGACPTDRARELLVMRKPQMSSTCKKLCEKGLLCQEPGKLDKRGRDLRLTQKGRESVESLRKQIELLAPSHIRPVAEGEIDFYTDVAAKVTANLRLFITSSANSCQAGIPRAK